MFVKDILAAAREKLVTIADDAQLIDIARLLVSGTDLVVVCNSTGVLQGIITKTDVVKQMSVCHGAACMAIAASIMCRDPVLCRAEDTLQDVSALMKSRHLKNIPVVDAENKAIGVATARAVLRVLLSDVEYEEALLIGYVKGIGYR